MKMNGRVTILDLLTRTLLFNAFWKLLKKKKMTCTFLLVACVPIIRCVCIQQLTVWEGAAGKGLFPT